MKLNYDGYKDHKYIRALTPVICAIPTQHIDPKYASKCSKKIKLNAGCNWGSSVPMLSDPEKIFINPRFIDIHPSTQRIS